MAKKVPKDMVKGTKHTMHTFGELEIVEYLDHYHVTVHFTATGYMTETSAQNIRVGHVRDRLVPTEAGVGFLGVGKYPASGGIYDAWRHMLHRCYSLNYHTYEDCSVVPEWFNYQIFAEWANQGFRQGLELDKDVKVPGNRIYGPNVCSWITHQENSKEAVERTQAKTYTFISPEGELVTFTNLNKFARDNNLSAGHLCNVAQGKRKSHKGWKTA